jgi:hypothetical protein
MANYIFSYDEKNHIIITDAKTNLAKDTLQLLDSVEHTHAFRVLTQGRKADAKASDVAISLLCDLLENPRMDGYKGNTPINEPVSNLAKSALRDVELLVLQPEFEAALINNGKTPAQAQQAWTEFKNEELNKGSYSNAKSTVIKMFCYMGKLPKAPNGKLLPLHAVKRMVEDFMQAKENPDNEGISSRLVSLASALDKRTETTKLGDYPSAIAALKSMLATFEGLYREQLENITQLHSDGVMNLAGDAMAKAMEKPSIESIEAMHDNGQIDDVTYQIMMLEHHNIQIEFE